VGISPLGPCLEDRYGALTAGGWLVVLVYGFSSMIFVGAPHRIIMIGGMTDISMVCSEQHYIYFVRTAVHQLLW
jgi:hypothetical protein